MQIALRSAGGVPSFDDFGEGEGDVFLIVRRLVDEERVQRRAARDKAIGRNSDFGEESTHLIVL